jgi:hypothetical protein
MTISLNITVDSASELHEALRQLASGYGVNALSTPFVSATEEDATAPDPEPKAAPKRSRAAKQDTLEAGSSPAASEESTATDTTTTTAPADVSPSEPEPQQSDEPAYDFDRDVVPKVLAAVKNKGKPFVEGVLEQFGVALASEVPPEQLGELIAALEG